MRVAINYLERPATEEELQIAELLEQMLKLIQHNELETLETFYHYGTNLPENTEVGDITSKENKRLKNIREGRPKMKELVFRDVLIRVKSAIEATVFFQRAVLLSGEWRHRVSSRVLNLQKIQNRWYILYS